MQMEHLLEAATKHRLSAAVGMALESCGVKVPRFVRADGLAQRKNALLDAGRETVLRRLEEAGIWHVPLKLSDGGELTRDEVEKNGNCVVY